MAPLVREALDQQLPRLRQGRAGALHLQPFAHIVGETVPGVGFGQEMAYPVGQPGRHRHAGAAPAGDARTLGCRADDQVAGVHPHHLQGHAGEEEAVPRPQGGGEPLLHRAELAPIGEAHRERGLIDDDAGIHPVLLDELGVRHPPCAVGLAHQPLEPVIGAQRIAAAFDEMQHMGKALVGQRAIGGGGSDFGQQFLLAERPGTGDRHHMLGQHVERAGAEIIGVPLARLDRVQCRPRLQIFEAVAGDQYRLRRHVEPVIGAADALEQARAALGRAHLDHAIDIAPIDAEVEAGGRHQRAQLARRHRRLDLAPRLDRQAAMMDGDRQVRVIDRP